jgi:hypothetical protein
MLCPDGQNRLFSWYFIDVQAVKGYLLFRTQVIKSLYPAFNVERYMPVIALILDFPPRLKCSASAA